jgi:LCP family protein required for cell wall assembly
MPDVASDDSSGSPDDLSGMTPDVKGGKRKARVKKRHTVAKVVASTLVAIALVTGLSVVFLYRHYNSNLTVLDVTGALKNRPTHKVPTGPSGPLNILIMGSDNRDAPGDHIDNLTGIGKRSDTTILLHLSADRRHAYGISIPRDSVVHRAACYDTGGKEISAATDGAMWNDAFNIGGAACTIEQFEQLTKVPVDHYIVVDFAGFKSMVDAIGGVDVCIPHAVNDTIGHITLPAGNHKLSGTDALNYVRERHSLGNGGDIDRISRQQAFIASMAHAAISANTLANPIHLTRFINAATKSLTVDPGLKSISKLVGLGLQFRHIGLNKIQFVTTPWAVDPSDPNRVVWTPAATAMWKDIVNDRVLPKAILSGAINAHHIPGVTHNNKKNSQTAQNNLTSGLCA